MKNSWMSLFTLMILFSTAFTFFSCENNEEEPETAVIEEEEILAIVSVALVTESEGATAEAVEMAYVAEKELEPSTATIACGETTDSTFITNINESWITGTYENALTWGLNCNGNIPISIFYGRQMDGSYETERLLSEDEATSNWLMESLLTGPNYIISGSYERNGTQESKVRDMHSFVSTVLLEVDNLNIDKGEKQIVSGVATFTLSGTANNTSSFSQTGTIVFLGNGQANIIFNGNTYTVDLF
ncbi:hypothetical protein [Lewinella sp. LCG006]|uniref:hypothetical protein n=1 Tax=Lewinella sp. LCG006 TaxID=3231911 RepID=UPI003460B269